MKKIYALFFAFLLIISSKAFLFAQAEVTRAGSTWTATVNGSSVYTGSDMIAAIQSAANNLTSGRTSKETINVRNSGSTGSTNSLKTFDIPSFTILDFHGNTMDVNDTGDDLIVPVRGIRSDNIEIRNMTITGNPRYGIWLHGCANVVLSQIHISIPEARNIGLGIRIEGRNDTRSQNVEIDYVFAEHCAHHAVEIWDTDNVTIGTIETRNTGGCGLLLNRSTNATVELIDAYRANHGGGYAAFRTANNAGPDIHVKKVIARECGRGIFGVSQSRGVTIDWVDIENSNSAGIFIEDSWDYTINGGIISGSRGEGVRIASRTNEHQPAQNVTIRNLCISGDHSYGIRETSSGSGFGNTNNNRFIDNDLRGSASNPANEISIQGSQSIAEGNCVTGGPVYEDCGCEGGEGGEPDCNDIPGGTAVLDDCEECVGGNTGKQPCTMAFEEGYYQIRPYHSDLCLHPGDIVTQEACSETSNEVWQITQSGSGYHISSVTEDLFLSYGDGSQENTLTLSETPSTFRIETLGDGTYHLAVENNTDLVIDMHGNSVEPGRQGLLWVRNGQDNQRFTFAEMEPSFDCNGDLEGAATEDDCGDCVGGNTGKTACAGFVDGPDACVYEGAVEAEHDGFMGNGYLNGDNALGNTILYVINSENAQSATLSFRYANGSSLNRAMEVKVNGETQVEALGFNFTGAWSDWEIASVSLDLSQGNNRIELVSLTEEGGPNFDLIGFDSPNIILGSCEEDCHGDIAGTAFEDECGICAGGNTGIEPGASCEDPSISDFVVPEGEIFTGDPFILSVNSSGPGELTFQWYFNGDPIADATGSSYTVDSSISSVHSGAYHVVVSNEYGETSSEVIEIDVQPILDCNGDPDGTAFEDECGVCAGGNTGIEPGSSCEEPTISELVLPEGGIFTGDPFGLSVNSTGPGELTFQWYFNGDPIADATGSSYTVDSSISSVHSGAYHVVVSNEYGETSSEVIEIDVQPILDCNGDPDGAAFEDECGICAGGNTGIEPGSSCEEPSISELVVPEGEIFTGDPFILSVNSSGPGELTFQWYFNGDPIADATGSSYTVDSSISSVHSGAYHVVVSNEYGETSSDIIDVNVQPKPDCNGDPDGSAFEDACGICAGGNTGIEPGSNCEPPVIISVEYPEEGLYTGDALAMTVNYEGPGTISYQWYHNGSPISGATSRTYEVDSLYSGQHSGSYHVVVSNEFGETASDVIEIVVNAVTDCNGDPDGTAYEDACGECVGGNTGEVPCEEDCNGAYGGTASIDSCGVCAGGNTGVAFGFSCALPEISDMADAYEVNVGDELVLEVDVSGPGNNTYQWYFNGEPIEGATESSFAISDASSDDAGVYYVVVNNDNGETRSDDIHVSVADITGLSRLNSQTELKVYPNPAHDRIHVAYKVAGNRDIRIFNGLGTQVYFESTFEQTKLLDISSLPAGIYFLRLEVGEETKQHPFIVE
ncbi:immunoglobulin domain-containing protein [Cytophagaceae bacterium ABcell3]|nr:immunoglobulin domain-containing protein [Cytophagaceae bacterium ABcell3]